MTNAFQDSARDVIRLEAEALGELALKVDERFDQACQAILDIGGRVVVVGMGKSGHIGGKIAASLASTGTPAFFVHPGEASHGDLGMITTSDLVVAISNSGETAEVVSIVPIVKRLGVKMIALTGNNESSLARQADACLNVGVEIECSLDIVRDFKS